MSRPGRHPYIRSDGPTPATHGRRISPAHISTGSREPPGRHRRKHPHHKTATSAALAVTGIVTAVLLFNPFAPPPDMTNTSTDIPQAPVDLGPLPFDFSAPPPPSATAHAPSREPATASSPSRRSPGRRDKPRQPTGKPITRISPSAPTAGTPASVKPVARRAIWQSFERSTAQPTSSTKPAPTHPIADLPAPRPPQARLSTSTVALGAARSGSISVDISPGTGTWSPTVGSKVSVQRDGSITVDTAGTEPSCHGPGRTESEIVTIPWEGTNSGDGITTVGTTIASGTLSLTVTWTINKDKGTYIGDLKSGGSWGNCG